MTSRAAITLATPADRNRARIWIANAPAGTRVDFKAPKRSTAQNDRLWAMLTDVARQLTWHGARLRTEDWKLVFLDGLKREFRAVPNLDGTGFVRLGRSSSDLSREEFSDLIELIFQFGAQHGVIWSDPKEIAMRELDARSAPLMIEDHSAGSIAP